MGQESNDKSKHYCKSQLNFDLFSFSTSKNLREEIYLSSRDYQSNKKNSHNNFQVKQVKIDYRIIIIIIIFISIFHIYEYKQILKTSYNITKDIVSIYEKEENQNEKTK